MIKEKAQQLILGLLQGDSKTWAAARQRLNLVPPKRRRRLRFLDEFAEVRNQSSIPVPYLHSTHESVLNPVGPADVSEWFAVSMLSAAGLSISAMPSSKREIWAEISELRATDSTQVRGRLGTTIALETISLTGSSKTAGKDNPHYFDDLSLVRAMAVAIIHGAGPGLNEELMAELSITVSHDGLIAGVVFGELTAALLEGHPLEAAIEDMVDKLAENSWSHSVVVQSLELAKRANSIDELALLLEEEIADHVYSYQIAIPETMAMAVAYLSFATTRDQLLIGGFLNSSRSEVLAPVLWGLAGVLYGGFGSTLGKLQGLSIKALKGKDLSEMFDDGEFLSSSRKAENND